MATEANKNNALQEQNSNLLKALEYRNVQLHSLFRSLPDQYYLFTRELICTEFLSNDLSELLIPTEKIGSFVKDCFEDEVTGYTVHQHIIQAISSGKVVSCKIQQLDILNQTRFFECRFYKVNFNEVMMIARDITLQEVTLQKYQLKVNELKTANEKLSSYIQSNEELSKFAYIVAHDLKEPIRNISYYAQSAKKNTTDRNKNNLQLIDEVIERTYTMNKMIDDLLLYSSVENQNLVLEKFKISDLLKDVESNIKLLIEENEATITLNNDVIINADRSLFRNVFSNIIANSIKYKNTNAPVVTIWSEKVKDKLKLFINDNGIGVDPKYHNYIFETFNKVRQVKTSGIGLGLAICKKIINRHNGTISISSKPNEGSTINITLGNV